MEPYLTLLRAHVSRDGLVDYDAFGRSHGERESIRNINKTLGLFSGKGPLKERLAEVAGETLTLDEIEHEIIRKHFSEPRIHFALVCAAMGCPPLRTEAYVGEDLDHFHPAGPARDLLRSGRFRVELTDYDWSLNQGSAPNGPAGTSGIFEG